MAKKLELFYFPQCPFCQMVLGTIQQLDVEVELLDIHQNSKAHQRLVDDTGRQTVPCLYIDNKPMFESSDIMAWLKQNYSAK